MAQTTYRVGGVYTNFHYNGNPLGTAQILSETGPQPVANVQPIQPLDQPYPVEIALPAALQAGTLTITFLEEWNQEVWAQLGADFANAADLLGVFAAQLAQGAVTCTKIITSPSGSTRTISYNNCVVTNVTVDETVQIGTMTIPKTITLMYLSRTEALSG